MAIGASMSVEAPSKAIHTDRERESLRVAEAARQTEWTEPSFLKEIFLGNLQMHLIRPIPDAMRERPEFTAFYERLKTFLLAASKGKNGRAREVQH